MQFLIRKPAFQNSFQWKKWLFVEIQSVPGLCHGFIKSAGALVSLCSFLSINSITSEHFPATCPHKEPSHCCSLDFTCTPRAGPSPAQGDRGRLRLQLGCLNFHISFPSPHHRVSVSIRDQDNFDPAIFILYYIFSLLHGPLFLPLTEKQWVISLFSIINSLGKKKTRQSHCRDRSIFFFNNFCMFFSEAGFILIP